MRGGSGREGGKRLAPDGERCALRWTGLRIRVQQRCVTKGGTISAWSTCRWRQSFPPFSMNRRIFTSGILAMLSTSLWAAEESAPAEPDKLLWIAGGRNQGTAARKVEWELGSFGLEWAGQKFWGVEKNGE